MTRTDSGREATRYGIGEWFGRRLATMSPQHRRELAAEQLLPRSRRPIRACPFKRTSERCEPCSKSGGVCSLLPYIAEGAAGAPEPGAKLSTTCPARFAEGGVVHRWVAETLLGHEAAIVVGEVGFLEREGEGDTAPRPGREDVGRIDSVLAVPSAEPLQWCALEIQAVYFSGDAMSAEFRALREWCGEAPPYPVGRRRPDYRSSGPKRLMPQLQVKVPTLRRWGKRMAVVVDEAFFGALGHMDSVQEVSNCDIVWFVVGYEAEGEVYRLVRRRTHFTTLERAVEGLTAGKPVSREVFESRIREKLRHLAEEP